MLRTSATGPDPAGHPASPIPDLSIVILSFNRCEQLRRTLGLLRDQQRDALREGWSFEVIVVDNASTDGSAAMVADEYQDAQLLRTARNVGISGWNAGFERARAPFVFVLDDDSRPSAGTLARSLGVMLTEPRIGVLACEIRTADGGSDTAQYRAGSVLDFVGCGALIRAEVFDRVGMFDPAIFLYAHETEFSMRVRDAGWEIRFDPEAVVVHDRDTAHRELRGRVSARRVEHSLRSLVYLLLKHYPVREVAPRLLRLAAGRLLFALAHGCGRSAWQGLRGGIAAAVRNRDLRRPLHPDVRRAYGRGSFAGGFFGPEDLAFRSPFRRRVP